MADEAPSHNVSFFRRLYMRLSGSNYDLPYLLALILFEAMLCAAIITRVSYTEIDWKAYMQEVEGYLSGERDYNNIRGDTGPLVYPAGFLYLYSCLRKLAGGDGSNILTAQCIFVALYLANAAVVLSLYTTALRCKRLCSLYSDSTEKRSLAAAHLTWSWRFAMGLTCLSKRVHSIFFLRLFNDGPAMLLFYISAWLLVRSKWRLGCFAYSCAVSIKMNVLLFAPGLLLLLLQSQPNLHATVNCLAICASVQIILGTPFLRTFPLSYFGKAFELDRVFFYKWTVNWKFLSEEIFLSRPFSILLLLLHLSSLAIFAFKWLSAAQSVKRQSHKNDGDGKHRPAIFFNSWLSPHYVLYTLFVSNFVGVCFARTLHYQFYSWYFHSLPLMLWTASDNLHLTMRVILLGTVEYGFNVFPATEVSSIALQTSHFILLACIWFGMTTCRRCFPQVATSVPTTPRPR